MVLQALNFIHQKKPTQLLIVWKLSLHHIMCDENHEERLEARVQALLETVDNNPPQRIRPCDLQKLINSLKFRKTCGIYGIPSECLRHLPRRPLVH
jgi:hypothetical protein